MPSVLVYLGRIYLHELHLLVCIIIIIIIVIIIIIFFFQFQFIFLGNVITMIVSHHTYKDWNNIF